jgi:hypothetical protein
MARAVWENPEELDGFCGCNTNPDAVACSDSKTEQYPIDPDLVIPMYKMTLELLGVTYEFPEDRENNAAADTRK